MMIQVKLWPRYFINLFLLGTTVAKRCFNVDLVAKFCGGSNLIGLGVAAAIHVMIVFVLGFIEERNTTFVQPDQAKFEIGKKKNWYDYE